MKMMKMKQIFEIFAGKKAALAIILICIISIIIPIAAAFLLSEDSLQNPFTVGENQSHIEEDFGSYDSFEAGKDYTKKVSVKNDGSVDCYVRVFAEVEDPEVAAAVDVDFNTTDWTAKQPDGFYYYKKIIKANESTVPLFTQITAKKDVDEFQMIVFSETVQADGAADPVGAFR